MCGSAGDSSCHQTACQDQSCAADVCLEAVLLTSRHALMLSSAALVSLTWQLSLSQEKGPRPRLESIKRSHI